MSVSSADLERDVRHLEARIRAVEERLSLQAAQPAWAAPESPRPAPAPRPAPLPRAVPLPPGPAPRSPRADLEDLLGGRVLAWVGGIAVCVGLAFLLAVAISRGWIGEGGRVALGAAVSSIVLGAGAWLHERRGRTDASLVAAGAGIAGLFATVAVGSALYAVLPVAAGLVAAAAVAALATVLAIRWSAEPIAALGIGGALAAPFLVGAPHDVAPLAFEGIAAAAATAVVTWRRWTFMLVAGPALVLPQWLLFLADRQPPTIGALAVLLSFGVLGAVTAVGHDVRLASRTLRFGAAFLLGLNAIALGLAGWFTLGGGGAGAAWLAGLAVAHGLPALRVRDRVSHELRLLALTLAIALLDAAALLTFHGPFPALGWSLVAVAFAAVARRKMLPAERHLAIGGLGAHVGIALIRAAAGEGGVLNASPSTGALLALAGVSAACLASARLQDEDHAPVRTLLDAFGLLMLAGLTAQLLSGPALAAAWAGEAVALVTIARRTGDPVAGAAGLAFLAGASLHAMIFEAPPASLAAGPPDLLAAAVALGAVTLGAARAGRIAEHTRIRVALAATAASTGLYLASVAIVTAFQGGTAATLFDLGMRQEGQLVLSAFWAAAGVAALLAGLRVRRPELRLGALALLGLAAGKVFIFDLATLTAGYRVASFLVLGLLLLVAGFAYERRSAR